MKKIKLIEPKSQLIRDCFEASKKNIRRIANYYSKKTGLKFKVIDESGSMQASKKTPRGTLYFTIYALWDKSQKGINQVEYGVTTEEKRLGTPYGRFMFNVKTVRHTLWDFDDGTIEFDEVIMPWFRR